MSAMSNYVSMREAEEIFGVSNFTIWQMVRDGRRPAYQSETDRRKKLIRRTGLEELKQPKLIRLETDRKKSRGVLHHAAAGERLTLVGSERRTQCSTEDEVQGEDRRRLDAAETARRWAFREQTAHELPTECN